MCAPLGRGARRPSTIHHGVGTSEQWAWGFPPRQRQIEVLPYHRLLCAPDSLKVERISNVQRGTLRHGILLSVSHGLESISCAVENG